MGFLIGVFCAVIFMDLRFYKIPNLCIAAGMASGLIGTYADCSVAGLAGVAAGMFVVFMAFYPFYLLGGIGAGDVKLFMMMCCHLQGERLMRYLLVTMILAAVLAAVKMAWYAESRQRLCYLGRYLRKAVLTGCIDEYMIDKEEKKCVIRLSIPAFASLLLLCAGCYR